MHVCTALRFTNRRFLRTMSECKTYNRHWRSAIYVYSEDRQWWHRRKETRKLKVRQIRNDFFKPTFLPKNERTNSTLLLVDLFSFVFWKKVKTPKRHFKINWPLAHSHQSNIVLLILDADPCTVSNCKAIYSDSHQDKIHYLCRRGLHLQTL